MKRIVAVLLVYSLIIGIFSGCGISSSKTVEKNISETISETVDEIQMPEEELSGIVPLSKRVNKGKMIAFGCMGDLHNGTVFKIFFFDHGKVTVVRKLESIGEYGGFELISLEELSTKSEEQLWELCDDFKKSSEEYVQALIANNENAYNRLTNPDSLDYDSEFTETVTGQPDSGYVYDIVMPAIDAPFVISIETDETNSNVLLEQIVIATQRVHKTYGGTKITEGAIDGDFYLTNMAEGGEIEIGDKVYSAYPAFESNITSICLEEGSGFCFDALDLADAYINNKEAAYNDAGTFFVK